MVTGEAQRLDSTHDAGGQPGLPLVEEPEALVAAEAADPSRAIALRQSVEALAGELPEHARRDWLDDGVQELVEIQAQVDEVVQEIAAVQDMHERLDRMAGDSGAVIRRIQAARAHLDDVRAEYDRALTAYYRLEFRMMRAEMRTRRAYCEIEARRYMDTRARADSVRRRLGRRRRWLLGHLVHPWYTRRERTRLKRRLADLERRSERQLRFLGVDEINGWIDLFVEAGVNLDLETWQHESASVRPLFYQLLNVLCVQDRMPASRVATDMVLPAVRSGGVTYCAETDKLLGAEFAQRRLEPVRRFGGTASERTRRVYRIGVTMREEYQRLAGVYPATVTSRAGWQSIGARWTAWLLRGAASSGTG